MRSNSRIRKMCTLGLLAALAIALTLVVKFPLFPEFPFLEYDAGDAVILIGAYLYGPLSGILLTLIVSLVQGFTVSASAGLWGVLMHFCATSVFVCVASLFYRRTRRLSSAVLGLVLAPIAATIVMIPLNLWITSIYMNVPQETVKSILLPVILPFNLIKFSINAALGFLLWRPLRRLYARRYGEGDVL